MAYTEIHAKRGHILENKIFLCSFEIEKLNLFQCISTGTTSITIEQQNWLYKSKQNVLNIIELQCFTDYHEMHRPNNMQKIMKEAE